MPWSLSLLLALSTAAGPDPRPLVVIDPGHGGQQHGASGVCGVSEKDVVLTIAQELARALQSTGRVEARLTRTTDRDLALDDRPALANSWGADIFVSIHANASTSPNARGVETFFLSHRSANRRFQHLTDRENEGRPFVLTMGEDPLEQLLHGLRLDASHKESQRLAIQIQKNLAAGLGVRARGVLQAPFIVLLGAEMSAALVEVGFLTHKKECQQLTDSAHQKAVARSLATALLAHLATERRAGARR